MHSNVSIQLAIFGLQVQITIVAMSRANNTVGVSSKNENIESKPTASRVNLLDLASACVACTNVASIAIQTIENEQSKNTRLKEDGSFVTDADFVAQGVIVQAIREVSKEVRIIGEESEEEMTRHMNQNKASQMEDNPAILQRTSYEIRLRYHNKIVDVYPLASFESNRGEKSETDVASSKMSGIPIPEDLEGISDPEGVSVEASRVSVVVDPLDGTKSYANGDPDAVSILIGILLDNQPYFGVVGKPFGYNGLDPMLDKSCVCIYGGPLLNGVYVAGQAKPIESLPLKTLNQDHSNIEDMPRAVISSSRSKGVVNDFCSHLFEHGLIHPQPLLISGAGEKSLRLILQRNNEALWFFPKAGTSRWDIAAPDALLRALGGKLTDKFGNDIDYNTTRTDSENLEGVVACINAELHSKCIELFSQGDWINQI